MSLGSNVNRIADGIVDLVEQANGPVLFNDLDDKVPGFHSTSDPAYSYFAGREDSVVWDGMSEAGLKALGKVLRERRVAVQMVHLVLPLMVGKRVAESSVPPYVLLPVRAANMETPSWAMRVSSKMQQMMLSAGKRGYHSVAPQHVRFTADDFSF